ncbi:MAG: hypothetical protein Kow0077_10230 [Anaerolineae bacterium]
MRCRIVNTVLIMLIILAAPATIASAQGGSPGQTTIHVVQRGETLYRIALNYGTSVEAIAQTNGLSDVTSIQVGQRLVIPSGQVNAAVMTEGRHVVQPGETLEHIALRYGSTPEIVAALNNILNPAQIYAGQVLDVSQSTPGHQPLAHGYTHTVQASDTLPRIALRYGVSLNAILRANNLGPHSTLYPGQQLLVPGPETAPTFQVLPEPLSELSINPLPIEVGRSFAVRVRTTVPSTVTGTFLDRDVRFASEPDSLNHVALVGVYALTEPGQYPLVLTIQGANGSPLSFTTALRIKDGGYGREQITVPQDQLVLLDDSVNASEHEILRNAMSGFTPERYYSGALGLPAAAPVTSSFGTRRSYNGGGYTRFHTGTDFGGPPGAPIYAPADGRVVMVETLNIYGLFTVIDHGWGLFTAYAHQSESLVSVGQFVRAGEVIGKIGNTGRSIGPHLHWEVWVNGVEVDGIQWTRRNIP